jgi:type II secretory pathway pseudopilin PulG
VPGWVFALIAVPLIAVFMIAILAVIGIAGFRSYLGKAKAAEARSSLNAIGRDAAAAYEREDLARPNSGRRVCPSASKPVPVDEQQVSGRKYLSTPSEWQVDFDRNAGFACLRFEMGAPQYYQYDYQATATSFSAVARGDLDGNGAFSRFELRGSVSGTGDTAALIVEPNLRETQPEE